MTILRTRTIWRRPRAHRATCAPDELTYRECERVRGILRILRHHAGGWKALACAMGVKEKTLEQAANRRRRRTSAGIALRAARAAGIPVEEILGGTWRRWVG